MAKNPELKAFKSGHGLAANGKGLGIQEDYRKFQGLGYRNQVGSLGL